MGRLDYLKKMVMDNANNLILKYPNMEKEIIEYNKNIVEIIDRIEVGESNE